MDALGNVTYCRDAAGECDLPESCDGVADVCPDDVKSELECRPTAGECDLAESCDGISDACPADEKDPGIDAEGPTFCRVAAGECDLPESCNGFDDVCPEDSKSDGECRAIAGACDVAESCDGVADECPEDLKDPGIDLFGETTYCRAAAGECDLPESCDGIDADCPIDMKGDFECRGAVGECDLAESCDGLGDACPADGKHPGVDGDGAPVYCRDAAGDCDRPEACDGLGDHCPGDDKHGDEVVCRGPAGDCDLEERCDGLGDTCPVDSLDPGYDALGENTHCRPASDVCDVPESCDGASVDCPPDETLPADTDCDDGYACNGFNTCQLGVCTLTEPPAFGSCDDQNFEDGDGCDNNCRPTGCPNGAATAGEECDDGNFQNGDACENDCTVPSCGNGIVDTSLGEECDDGDLEDGDACETGCLLPVCGNGIVDGGEVCDDGNTVSLDGCSGDCGVLEYCGDDVLDPGEACDDGNQDFGDGCRGDCRGVEVCGDGVVDLELGEACDDGNEVASDGCDLCACPLGTAPDGGGGCQSVLAGFGYIPAGTFAMGSPRWEALRQTDEALHSVTLTRPFWAGEHEVTQGEWVAIFGSNPSYHQVPVRPDDPSLPVERVSWYDALVFANVRSKVEGLPPCYWLGHCTGKAGAGLSCPEATFLGPECFGYRLPTEAEWEYLARAGANGESHGELDAIAWHGGNSGGEPHPVGTKAANAFGLFDVTGNVWEWVWDAYGPYEGDAHDPIGGPDTGAGRVGRGSSWSPGWTGETRLAFRAASAPGLQDPRVGFRLVRTVGCPSGYVMEPGGGCAKCGDGFVAASEECDDGNLAASDGCDEQCRLQCGNGVLAWHEVCDDGNRLGGDGCRADCEGLEVCGDGLVDQALCESCDDGNQVDGDGCNADCRRTLGRRIEASMQSGLAPGWQANGAAHWDHVGVLTHPYSEQSGTMVHVEPAYDTSLLVQFEFLIGGVPPASAGDGMAFFLTMDGPYAFGDSPGSALGIGGLSGYGFELDTFAGYPGETGNDVAISLLSHSFWAPFDLVSYPALPFDLADGNWHEARIRIEEGVASFFVDGITAISGFQLPDFHPGPWYLGFGAATGEAVAEQWVRNVAIHVSPLPAPVCTPPACGDGILGYLEVCDDGNTASGDGCSEDCQYLDRCGDGEPDAGEACDDGNQAFADGCRGDCRGSELCGDGVLDGNVGELCDDHNLADGDGCDSNCRPTGCGNGVVTAGEECDDGNLVDDPTCPSTCLCPPGTASEGSACADIDGCAEAPCFPGATCSDVAAPDTGFSCGACPPGYEGDGIACSEIDACATHGCGDHGTCEDLPPPHDAGPEGRTCHCASGYADDDGSGCHDIDECLDAPCGYPLACIDSEGGFACECPEGTFAYEATCESALAGYAYVPAGRFTMGSPALEVGRESDEAQHEVLLTQPFWVKRSEVTQDEWFTLMGNNPSQLHGGSRPVDSVSWWDAAAYANALSEAEGLPSCYVLESCWGTPGDGWFGCAEATRLTTCTGYQLPTEAQWEYAARAGSDGPRYGPLGDIAWHDGNSGHASQDVTQLQSNHWGIHDVIGNAWEWCSDYYDAYHGDATNPGGPASGWDRILRGGSFQTGSAESRAANRSSAGPHDHFWDVSFRLVRTVGCPPGSELDVNGRCDAFDVEPVAWGAGVVNVEPLVGAIAVAAGAQHTLALRGDGTVVAWGDFRYGQSKAPPGLGPVTALAGGGGHSVALRADGTVVAWGEDYLGQADVPAGLTNVEAIAAGGYHTVALESDGTVVAWGDDSFGQATVPEGLTGVVAVAAGWAHTVALRSDGTVVGWGFDDHGQATSLGGLDGVVAIAAGALHTVALRSDGTVVALGANDHGQSAVPPGLTDVVAVAAGYYHAAALRRDGTVVAWGNNDEGQTAVPSGLDEVVAIAAGAVHTVALRADGSVIAWGSSSGGQTAVPAGNVGLVALSANLEHVLALQRNGSVSAWGLNVSGQTAIPDDLMNAVAVAAGGTHSLALDSSGRVLAWGADGEGQSSLPDGLGEVIAIAAGESHSLALRGDGTVVGWGACWIVPCDMAAGYDDLVAIAAGTNHSLALQADGTVIAAGYDDAGQTLVPPHLDGVIAIAAGWQHSVVLRADGTVIAWGSGEEGATSVPVGLDAVTAIAAGYSHTLALMDDGTVVAWGGNWAGQSDVPAGLADVVAIAAGGDQSYALVRVTHAPPPTIAAISAATATAGDVLTVTGTDFERVLAVRIGGVVAPWFVLSPNELTLRVPPRGRSGPVEVVTISGEAMSAHLDVTGDACAVMPCGLGATCTDLPDPADISLAGRTCECPEGQLGDPERDCADVDACANAPCPDQAVCIDSPGNAPGDATGRVCRWEARDALPAATNPVGRWSFGYGNHGDAPSAMTLYQDHAVTHADMWYHSNPDGYGNTWKNTEASSRFDIAPGELHMHSPCAGVGYVSSLLFVAPVGGSYRAAGRLDIGGSGRVQAGVVAGSGVVILPETVVNPEVAFDQTVTLGAGEVVRLWIQQADDTCAGDSTQVELAIELQ